MLQRHQHDVGRHRRAAERVHADRIGDRVEHRAVARADRRLADAAGTDRRLGIGQVERGRLQLIRDIENRQRLVVVEPPRERDAVLRIDHPLLAERVRDAEAAAAIELRDQAPRVDDLPDVPDRRDSRRASPSRSRRPPRLRRSR